MSIAGVAATTISAFSVVPSQGRGQAAQPVEDPVAQSTTSSAAATTQQAAASLQQVGHTHHHRQGGTGSAPPQEQAGTSGQVLNAVA